MTLLKILYHFAFDKIHDLYCTCPK